MHELVFCLFNFKKGKRFKNRRQRIKKRDRKKERKKERQKERTDIFLRRLVINLKNGARLIPICRSSKMIT